MPNSLKEPLSANPGHQRPGYDTTTEPPSWFRMRNDPYVELDHAPSLLKWCVFRAALATFSVRSALGAADLAQEIADLALDLS